MNKTSNNKHELLAEWFPLKEIKHGVERDKLPKISNGEIWWVAIGENMGVEIEIIQSFGANC